MKYQSFEIENFKGIHQSVLNVSDIPDPHIFTLVGLNESGKTTVLEALNTFHEDPVEPTQLIPKHLKGNFTGAIRIIANVALDDSDKAAIKDFLKDKGFVLENINVNVAKITKEFLFESTSYIEKNILWNLPLKGKTKRQKTIRNLVDSDRPVWEQTIGFVRSKLLPKIVYYPNFLFNFPPSILLKPSSADEGTQKFYREVLQDVLDSFDQDLDIQKHLVNRKDNGSKPDQEAIEKVLNDAGERITNEVFTAWSRVSGSDASNLSVTLGTDLKDAENGANYSVELKIKEGTNSFYINERSLGFRWFFAFLLFTQFRRYRKDEAENILFLLDEPASNLHETGQQELLASLEELTHGSTVIYSTHSHHLVNPKWLSGAFIVRNEGLNLTRPTLDDSYSSDKTDIKLSRYYSYVSHHPEEESHFKPVLATLDYRPSKLEFIPDIIITEGKFDYFALNYFNEYCVDNQRAIHFYPGAGCDKHDNIIRLYLAWGKNFILILDDDRGGINAAQRYKKLHESAVNDKIFTFKDIDKKFAGFTTEDIVPENERIKVIKSVFPSVSAYDKRQYNLALQENYLRQSTFKFNKPTIARIQQIIDFLESKVNRH